MTKSNLVIYFLDTPLSKRDFIRFGIDLFASKQSIFVLIIDWSKVFENRVEVVNPIDLDAYNNAKYYLVENTNHIPDSINEKIASSKKIILIDLIANCMKSPNLNYWRSYFYELSESVHISAGNLPYDPLSIFQYLQYLEDWKSLARILAKKLLKKIKILKEPAKHKPDWLFYSTNIPSLYIEDNIRSVPVHNLDYDFFLQNNESFQDKHILYLDQMFFTHPDPSSIFRQSFCDSQYSARLAFIAEISNVLDSLENKLQKSAIIASHPRRVSIEEDWRHEFSNVNTFDLIRDSTLVLAHSTVSVQMAVLLGVPIAFYIPKVISGTHDEQKIKVFAKSLGKKAYHNIGNLLENVEGEMCINEAAYQLYTKKYIKLDGTPKKLFWQVVYESVLGENEDSTFHV